MAIGDLGLTELDRAWVAGFLDGEGSFQIRAQRSARDRHQTSTVVTVSVSQAEPRTDVLVWLQRVYGGSVASHGAEKRNPGHNRALRWSVTGSRAVQVCSDTLPYLRLKRRHAELILEHQATKLASHVGGRVGLSRSAARVPPETAALRARHIQEIRLLNQRGLTCQ